MSNAVIVAVTLWMLVGVSALNFKMGVEYAHRNNAIYEKFTEARKASEQSTDRLIIALQGLSASCGEPKP